MLFALEAWLVVRDLSHANRPHELRYVNVVGALAVVGLAAAVIALLGARRAWRDGRRRAAPIALALVAIPLALAQAWLAAAAWG